jgi:hypothetical protein
VEIDEPEKKSIVIPNYSPVSEQVCTALSILFGKRFDNHGFLVSHQSYYVPDLGLLAPTTYFDAAPYSHYSRKDFQIPLELHRFAPLAPLFTDDSLNEKFRRLFFAAGRFYLRSLQMLDVEPEFAYLDLITCGEILANFYTFAPDDLFDENTKTDFQRIKEEMEEGDMVVGRLRQRMLQVRRRYTLTLTRLLTDSFFEATECLEKYGRLRKEDIEKRLKAAYDLRSQYVHTGIDFGRWIQSDARMLNEVQLGTPVVENKDFKKAIAMAPTFFGMERVMRYCLLRFVHLNGLQIDSALNDTASATSTHLEPGPNAEDSPHTLEH